MARRIAFVLALLPIFAFAQIPGSNPLEPTGFPLNGVRDNRLPPPLEQGAEFDFKVLRNKTLEINGPEVSGTELEFEYRGYRARADEAAGNLDTNQFVLRGNVNVLGQDEVVRGKTVFVDFRARTFRVVEGDADLKKTLMQGRLLSDVYIKSANIQGSETMVTATGAQVTTCEYPVPHYTFESAELNAEPNRRLVFHDFGLRVLGKKLFSIPKFVIPLNKRRTDNIAPDFGNSPDEGYYLKTKIGIPLRNDTAIARIDLMSQRGLGLGADYEFLRSRQNGEFRVYSNLLNGAARPDFTGSARYRGDLSFGAIDLSHQMRAFSYLNGPNNTAATTQLSFRPRQSANAQSQFLFSLNDNRSSTFSNRNVNAMLSDNRAWTKKYRSNVQLTFTGNNAASGGVSVSERKVLDARIETSYDAGQVLAELNYFRNIPIGSTFNFIGGLDRTPELTLRTDTRRWFGTRPPAWVPNFTALFSAGDYKDNFNNINVGRYYFEGRINRAPRPGAILDFSYDAGFKQGVYTDNAAQYTPSLNVLTTYRPTKKSAVNFRYNYNKQFGFSPIQMDRTGRYNIASFDFLLETLPGLMLGGQGGYDFERESFGEIAWQSPSIRLEYKPNTSIRFRSLADYLPQSNSWGNIRWDLSWRAGDTFLGIAARYDALRGVWGNVNVYVDAFKWGRLKVSTLLLYNGYLQRFDTRHLALTYDLHCAEAVLQILENNTGFRPGRQVLFFIRLKALPFNSPFGIGTLGQPLDIGTGFGG